MEVNLKLYVDAFLTDEGINISIDNGSDDGDMTHVSFHDLITDLINSRVVGHKRLHSLDKVELVKIAQSMVDYATYLVDEVTTYRSA